MESVYYTLTVRGSARGGGGKGHSTANNCYGDSCTNHLEISGEKYELNGYSTDDDLAKFHAGTVIG
jgi:hypothetical protein